MISRTGAMLVSWMAVVLLAACGQDPESTDFGVAAQTTTEQECHAGDRAVRAAEVRRVLRLLEQGHVHAIGTHLANNAVWIQTGVAGQTPFAGTYEGRPAILRMLAEYEAAVDTLSITSQYSIVSDNLIDAHVNVTGRVRATGKTFDLEFLYGFVFNERNKISEVRAYYCTYSMNLAFSDGGDSHVVDLKGNTDPWSVHAISADPLSVVQVFYEALESADAPTLFSLLSPNVLATLKGAVGTTPYAGTFEGQEGLLTLMLAFFSSAQYTAPMIFEHIVAEGNTVDVMFIESVLALPTGKMHTIRVTQSFKLDEDGYIVEWKSYNDSQDVYRTFLP